MASNYGFRHMPKIVRYAGGKARSTIRLPIQDSAALYLGAILPQASRSAGIEFGVAAFTDDDLVLGIAKGFYHDATTTVPVWEDDRRSGTVTDATGELPLKYTASSTNDGSNATPKGEYVEVAILMPGDIIEVALMGASTTSVPRGTTTAAGTTGSSANLGVSMSVNTTYHFGLLESTAAVNTANLDFITVEVDGHKPKDPNHVYVMCMVKSLTAENAAS